MLTSRRRVLRALGLSPVVALALPRRVLAAAPPVEELARRLLDAPRDRVFDLVGPLLDAGLSWHDLEAAVFVAGIREVSPRPLGNKLHAVLATESVFQWMESGDPGPAVLWSLDALKQAQEQDERAGDWSHCAPPADGLPDGAAAARELHAAFARQDAPRADRAVVALVRHAGRAGTMQELWPHALDEFFGLCHRVIFAAHVDRTAARLEPAVFEPAVRSLVWGLMLGQRGATTAEYAAARRLAPSLRADWEQGRRDPRRSVALCRALRGADCGEARALVVEASAAGLHPGALWDGLRLAAADLFVRARGLLAAHATTVTNALFHVQRASASDDTRRHALLMAASWMPHFRERFMRSRGVTMGEPGIEPLLEHPGDVDLRSHLFRAVDEVHQVKYSAAVLDDVSSAHPSVGPVLRAAARGYVPDARTPASALGRRIAAFCEGR